MKNKKNKELLKKIKETIEEYDSNDIIIDSYLIGGSEKIFTPPTFYSTDVLYYSGYISSEDISNPKKLLGKTHLINEYTNKIIDASFENKEAAFIRSLSIRNVNDDHTLKFDKPYRNNAWIGF